MRSVTPTFKEVRPGITTEGESLWKANVLDGQAWRYGMDSWQGWLLKNASSIVTVAFFGRKIINFFTTCNKTTPHLETIMEEQTFTARHATVPKT